jgi:hypothetical protein
MKKENWILGLSISAILVSVTSLCVICIRNNELNMDWYGVLIGILSLLVTLLLGWQIYNAVTMESRLSKMTESVKKEFKKVIDCAEKETEIKILHTTSVAFTASKNYELALDFIIKAIASSSDLEDAGLKEVSIVGLENVFLKMKSENASVEISEDNFKDYSGYLMLIRDPSKTIQLINQLKSFCCQNLA